MKTGGTEPGGPGRVRRILWVGTNPGGGGTETHMVTMLQALASAGVDTHALVHPGGRIASALANGPVTQHAGVFRNSADLRGIRALDRVLKAIRPDVVVGSFSKEYWPLALLARRHGHPLVLFRHMDLRLRPSTRGLLSRWPLRLFAISRYLQRRLVEQGLPASRVEYLPNPLIPENFVRDPAARRELRRQLGIAEDAFLAGYVGAWHRGKGVFALADAVDAAHARDPRIHALWLGGGVHGEAFRQRLQDCPWHRLAGWQDDPAPWYSAMDALALPSIEPDTFGRVCVEAQACGTPVLGSNLGGIPEAFAPDRSGLLLPPGDVAAWTGALLRMADDSRLREDMGAAGRPEIRRFDARQVAARFLETLETHETF